MIPQNSIYLKQFYKTLFLVFASLLLVHCARKGSPDGGPKDETAPIMVTAKPPYKTVNFNKKKITIYFDEYIVLKDLTKQLIVSPPLKNPPVITPQGTPSKYITIELLDTLQTNTTYIFNFGNAVQDNNENNKLENFKYVFSTGKYIDSLSFKGSVKDVFEDKKLKEVGVALYKLDEKFNDSIIYKEKPNYVSSTIDSTNFTFSNLKKGKYLVIALKEENKDYIFNPTSDKIGFVLDTISLPKDSVLTKPIVLFKEEQPFKFKRAKEVSKGKIQFGFTGKKEDFNVKLLSEVNNDFKFVKKFQQNKDTLDYWHTNIDADSLNFIISQKTFLDTVTVRLRKKKIDSLTLSPTIKGTLHPKDTFFIASNNPIINIDTQKISITDKDTLNVKYEKLLSKKENKMALLFEQKPEQNYTIKILPNAITDLFNQQNDTLIFKPRTQKLDNYGTIIVDLQNPENKKIIFQLLSNKKVIRSLFLKGSKKITLDLLPPQTYTLRAIIDSDDNKKWTTGSFLKKQPPEEIIYFPNEIKLRANWIDNEIFTIK